MTILYVRTCYLMWAHSCGQQDHRMGCAISTDVRGVFENRGAAPHNFEI